MSNVNHPSHYNRGGIECIDAIESAVSNLNGFQGYLVGNAIKYLWRHKEKGGVESLEKAIWHIERQIDCILEEDYENDIDDNGAEPFDVTVITNKNIHDVIETLAASMRDLKCK